MTEDRWIVLDEDGKAVPLTRQVGIGAGKWKETGDGRKRRTTGVAGQVVDVAFVTKAQADQIVRRTKTRLGRKYCAVQLQEARQT